MTDTLPVSIILPTIGHSRVLASCLDSLGNCRPLAAEIIVVDQSRSASIRRIVDDGAHASVRIIESDVPNKPRALNLGLREARHEIVLMTDDDCTVDASWVGTAYAHVSADPSLIVTGRVLPAGDPEGIASVITNTTRRDYTGRLEYGALYGGNMACTRSSVLELGGFDERFEAAEDNDLCYRWLRAGRSLRFEPDLVVWHHEWRAPEEMRALYLRYGRGQGVFYAKHLRRGDLRVARFLGRDLYRGLRGVVARALRGRTEWPDPRLGLLRGVLAGLLGGLRFRSRTRPVGHG